MQDSHVLGQEEIALKGMLNRFVQIEIFDNNRYASAWIGIKSDKNPGKKY